MPEPEPERRLAELAGTAGWRSLTAQEVPTDVGDAIRLLAVNQWDQHAYFNQYVDSVRPSQAIVNVAGPRFDEAYQGSHRGYGVLAANVRIFVSPLAVADEYNGRTYASGAVAVALPFALPPINVIRPMKSLFGGHGWRSGNEGFDRQFEVHAVPGIDDQTVALLSPLIAPMASRDDWTFAFGGPSMICVTHDPIGSPAELQRTLDQLVQLIASIPPEAIQQVGHVMPAMPAMPDGTPFDPDKIEQQLATMTPEQQAAFIVRMTGGRGLDEQQIADAIRRDQGRR